MSTPADLHDKVFVVTGANSGIGFEAARDFARRGATLALVCRNRQRGEEALERIRRENSNAKIMLYTADFSSMTSVLDLARVLLREYPRIDVLCNNAGGANANRVLTADGFELTLASNHLAGFLLTRKLLPALLAAAAHGEARVVFTSSLGHTNSPLDFDDLGLERGYSTLKAYGRSKLMNLLSARELHRRYRSQGIIASSFHPGAVRTPIWRKGGLLASFLGAVLYPFMIDARKGAETLIWLASSKDSESANADGRYFFRCRPKTAAAFATDESALRLWQASLELLAPFDDSAAAEQDAARV